MSAANYMGGTLARSISHGHWLEAAGLSINLFSEQSGDNAAAWAVAPREAVKSCQVASAENASQLSQFIISMRMSQQWHGRDRPPDATHGDAARWHLDGQVGGGAGGGTTRTRTGSTFGISQVQPEASTRLLPRRVDVPKYAPIYQPSTIHTTINQI